MLNLVVYLYCHLILDLEPKKYLTFGDCQHSTFVCIDLHDREKYRESNWTDTINEAMSLESFGECTRVKE